MEIMTMMTMMMMTTMMMTTSAKNTRMNVSPDPILKLMNVMQRHRE